MNKKIILTSMVCIGISSAALADGFYISPKISINKTSVDETRVETMVVNGQWAEFAGNKHESWSDKGNQVSPKIAVGYDFDLNNYGIFSIETEYGTNSNYFNGVGSDRDLDGNSPNDSDTRNFTYTEKTISLNAKYGYNFSGIIPFVTAGIGHSTIDSNNNFRSGTYWWTTNAQEKNLSWNIGAGIEVPVNEKVSINLTYLYTDLGNVKYSNNMYHNIGTAEGIERKFDSSVDLNKQEFIAGIKIAFSS